jgi:hypothetical protein
MEQAPHQGGELQATSKYPVPPLQESHDERVIRGGIEAAVADGRQIDDYTARFIAGQLHGGQGSALYSLASTGNINPDVRRELDADRKSFEPQVRGWVDALTAYCEAREDKGPVEGWIQRTAVSALRSVTHGEAPVGLSAELDSHTPAVVFIVSRNGGPTYRRVLWRVSVADAKKICSDPRTGIEAHPKHMLCWTTQNIDDPDEFRFIRDNGRYGDVLSEHGVKVLDSWQQRQENQE